jgi:pimeloyl-ACP methyl ester carboxylesterase
MERRPRRHVGFDTGQSTPGSRRRAVGARCREGFVGEGDSRLPGREVGRWPMPELGGEVVAVFLGGGPCARGDAGRGVGVCLALWTGCGLLGGVGRGQCEQVNRLELVPVGDARLEVEVMGRGEPVVVIQTALAFDELRPLGQRLAQSGEYMVVHHHRRGYAGSFPAVGQGSVAAEAADTAALIRAMDLAPAHVVGASYSAAVGLSLASSAPRLLRSLVVVEPPPVGTPGAAEFRHANAQLLETHEARGPQVALEEFMTMLVGRSWREVSERDMPGSVEAMERDAATFFGSDIPALLSWRFGASEAARVPCPILYVGGGQSSLWFTEMRARILHLLPDAEQATVQGAGHFLASTHPAELAALLLAHFRRHPRPGSGKRGQPSG